MMSLCKKRFLGCVYCLSLSACGTVSVQYAQTIPSPTDSSSPTVVASIVAAAAKGNQTSVLPVSRLVIVDSSAQAQNGGQNGGAVQGDAAPAPDEPAAAPSHAAAGGNAATAVAPKPAQLGTQPAPQAANQAGGNQATKTTDSTAPVSSVTTTLTSTNGKVKYSISVVQVESAVAFMVQPTNNFFSQNDFSITRLANTRIPTSVSNTFTDETASRVKAIASIAAAIIPLVAAVAPPHAPTGTASSPVCVTRDIVVDDDGSKPPSANSSSTTQSWKRTAIWAVSNVNVGGKCVDVTLSANSVAPDLIPISSLTAAFADKNRSGDWSRIWPVAACMTVQAVIKPHGAANDDSSIAAGQLTVIDPGYVELMPIPKKGKIAMHPICGADLADSATDPYQADFDTMSAIVAAIPAKSTSK
jgi:hypothetical protein